MASTGSSPPALSRSSSTTSLASEESGLGKISNYGLRRVLQKNPDEPRTEKDEAYLRHLDDRFDTLTKKVNETRQAFAQVFAERLAVETVNDLELLNQLELKLVAAAEKCGYAEREMDAQARHVEILGALPKMTKDEMDVFMLRVDEIAKKSSHDASRETWVPMGANKQVFEKARQMQAEYIGMVMLRNQEHNDHQDEFDQLVEAHFQLDDARSEISELNNELANVQRLYGMLANAVDAKTDADTKRQTTSLKGLLSRARAEARTLRDEKHEQDKTIKDLRKNLEKFADINQLFAKITYENKILNDELRARREASWEAENEADRRSNAEQVAKPVECDEVFDAAMKEATSAGHEVVERIGPDGRRTFSVIFKRPIEQGILSPATAGVALAEDGQAEHGGKNGKGVASNDNVEAAEGHGADHDIDYADADIDTGTGRLTLD